MLLISVWAWLGKFWELISNFFISWGFTLNYLLSCILALLLARNKKRIMGASRLPIRLSKYFFSHLTNTNQIWRVCTLEPWVFIIFIPKCLLSLNCLIINTTVFRLGPRVWLLPSPSHFLPASLFHISRKFAYCNVLLVLESYCYVFLFLEVIQKVNFAVHIPSSVRSSQKRIMPTSSFVHCHFLFWWQGTKTVRNEILVQLLPTLHFLHVANPLKICFIM